FLTFLRGTFRRYVQAIDRGQYVSVRWYDNWVRMLRGFAPDTCSMQGHCVCGFTVESDLSAYPCDFYALDEWKLGSLETESFARLVKSETARRFIQDSLPVPDACRACEWYALCRNGCRRERAQGLHRFCQAYQMFFPEAMPDLQRIARMTKIT
ncbi:MAG TPA: SPASM domain-containing protein, partial [Clostridia bacterium]|nr:SPASM domain-containing protein [Clostridia bacterium]